jgi:pimeloyl-ACP methyl ester carboxylesterase
MKIVIKFFSVVALGLLASSLSVALAFAQSGRSRTTDDQPLHSKRVTRKNKDLVAGTFDQPIDHFGALKGQTFQQRYWVDTQYSGGNKAAPVIFHICGEGDATQGYFLNDNAIEWAKSLGANLVYLEHRYYGQSLPFNDFETDHMQYLTLENVLEDFATFEYWISQKEGWSGKWISVGGSYSGTLSALYRQTYPQLVVGALAASAPMISGVGQDDDDSSGLTNTDPSVDDGGRPWAYESCTEFGFWQTDGSTLYEPSQSLCQAVFPGAPFYNKDTYNQKYYAPYLVNSNSAPSNILFTYGTEDIWTTIGLPPQSNSNSKITIQLIEGAGHHFDLNAPTAEDSQAIVDARAKFLSLAQQWLK